MRFIESVCQQFSDALGHVNILLPVPLKAPCTDFRFRWRSDSIHLRVQSIGLCSDFNWTCVTEMYFKINSWQCFCSYSATIRGFNTLTSFLWSMRVYNALIGHCVCNILDFSCIVFPYWEFTGNLQYLRTHVYLQEALYVTKFTFKKNLSKTT